jgi:hypothetical protein
MNMEIKDLKANQRDFYYQLFRGEQPEYDDDGYETGESKISYSEPIKASAMISENTSDAVNSPFGKDLVYDKLISTVQDLPIDEYSKLFVDVVPVIKEDGSTDTEPDYEVIRVSKGIYQRVWAIRKVEGYGNQG